MKNKDLMICMVVSTLLGWDVWRKPPANFFKNVALKKIWHLVVFKKLHRKTYEVYDSNMKHLNHIFIGVPHCEVVELPCDFDDSGIL